MRLDSHEALLLLTGSLVEVPGFPVQQSSAFGRLMCLSLKVVMKLLGVFIQ